jgi:hypothetical protein
MDISARYISKEGDRRTLTAQQALLARFPELAGRLILQDQPQVLQDALAIDGMATKGVDFFVEQPIKGEWPTRSGRKSH